MMQEEKLTKHAILAHLPVGQLFPGHYQPRQHFDEQALRELAYSIQAAGVLQPLLVRPGIDNRYEIIAGERRWRAAQIAGLSTLPCLVTAYTDAQAAQAAALENLNRVNLTPIEEAQMYQRLQQEFSYTHEELAAIVAKERSTITNMLRLLSLDLRVQALLGEGQLTAVHGRTLAALPLPEQYPLALRCSLEGWSTRKLMLMIKSQKGRTRNAMRKVDCHIQALEQQLADFLGCPVQLKMKGNNKQGELSVHFSNLEVLDGLFEKWGFRLDA